MCARTRAARGLGAWGGRAVVSRVRVQRVCQQHVPFRALLLLLLLLLRLCASAGTKNVCLDPADKRTGLSAFYLFTTPGLSVLHAADVRKVFATTVHRAPSQPVQRHLDAMLGPKALVSLMGDEWKFHRKLINSAFHPKRLAAMAADMSTVGAKLCAMLAGLARAGGPAGTVLEVTAEIKKAALDVIGLSAFGYSFECLSQQGPNKVAEAFSLMLRENDIRIFGNPVSPAREQSLPAPPPRRLHSRRQGSLGVVVGRAKGRARERGGARGRGCHAALCTPLSPSLPLSPPLSLSVFPPGLGSRLRQTAWLRTQRARCC